MTRLTIALITVFVITLVACATTPKPNINSPAYQDALWQKIIFSEEENNSVSYNTAITCKAADSIKAGTEAADKWKRYCEYLVCCDRRKARHEEREPCDRQFFGDAKPAPPE